MTEFPSWLPKTTRAILIGLALFGLVSALHPDLRAYFHKSFHKPYRKVLSTASGRLNAQGLRIKVVKIKTDKGLFLEIYDSTLPNARPLLSRIELPDKKDGYFHFQGQATNLALDDLNGDKSLEIIAPSFDEDMVAHLNVYTFNQTTETFVPYKK